MLRSARRIPDDKKEAIWNLHESGISSEIISMQLDLEKDEVLAFLKSSRRKKSTWRL
jgi:hypothetical protein